jgi:predicted acylesterase/phospholipase RssA
LSGGGAAGAFGAGFLNGWTRTGDRPEFKMVSGISTGALTAPIAFLGSKYDDLLREFFTTVETSSILQRLSLVTILFQSESFASAAPLKALIDRYFDLAFLRKIVG